MKTMLQVMSSSYGHLQNMATSIGGWITTGACALMASISGYETAVYGVLVATVMDLIWGVCAAVKRGSFAKSVLLRDTLTKILAYACTIAVVMFMERSISEDSVMCVGVVASIIMGTEIWSMFGSVLIVKPDFPVVVLLKEALKGEIAEKLKVDEAKVDEALSGCKKGKHKKRKR